MPKKKEIVEFIIDENEFGGKAYGYIDNTKISVKNAIKGQKVKAVISKMRNNKAEAKIMEVLERSPLEKETACNHFGICGGCFKQSVSYEDQLEMKENQAKKLFKELNIEAGEWLGIAGSPLTYNYRNKMEFSFGDEEKGGPLTLGMHKKGRHYDIVTVDKCLIMDEDFRKVLTLVLNYFREKKVPYYNSRSHVGYLRHLVVRKTHFTKEIIVNLVTTTQMEVNMDGLTDIIKKADFEGTLVGLLHTFNDNLADTVQSDKTDILCGQDFVTEELLGLKFKISAFSFFQTNSSGAEKLYSIVRDFVGNSANQTVFDLYCGTGTIGQIVAQNASKVIGIELISDAVDAANNNAKLNGLTNCTFIAGDVKEKIKEIKDKPDIIILDPPRAGIHPQALQDIIAFNAPQIVYVSCNPKTLVRDLAELQDKGYTVKKVKCMDMFPHTPHIECVVEIQKIGR